MKRTLLLAMILVFSFSSNIKAQIPGLIQEFNFNNSYANKAGDISFSATAFTTDRNGVLNSAIAITYSLQSQATIPGLPYGSASRSISFWAKANQFSGLNYDPVFTYGTGTNSNSFSGSFSADRVMANAHTDNVTYILGGGTQNLAGTWYHFTITYDGTTLKLYRNGVAMGPGLTKAWNTINNNDIFKLGIGVGGEQWFSGAIDDLKIYDRAVTDAEAEQIYKGDIDVCSNLLTYFSFDGGTSDHTGTVSFTTTDPIYPVTTTIGRSGGADYALQTFQAATQPRTITFPELPTGNSARTIAFWMKTSTPFSTSQSFFTYGTAANAQTFGLYNNASGALVFQGYGAGNDVVTSATIGQNTWAHIAVVYNSYIVQVYVSGILRHSFIPATTLNTGISTFKIGSFNGAVDDLSIYSRALSFGEIENLYNNSTLACPTKPVISAVSAVAGTGSATLNYSLRAVNLSTTSIVRYGLASNNLSNQVNGFSATGNTATPGNVQITGLQDNTLYYYQIEATNSAGTAVSTGSFTSGGAVAEYSFNGTYNNLSGNAPFTSANTAFVADRNSTANSAMYRTSTANTATITNLPIGTSQRTISLWVNSTDATNTSSMRTLFAYGSYSGGAPGVFNVHFNTDGRFLFEGNGTQIVNNSTVTHNQWFHFVISYNAGTVKVYMDGNLKHTFAKTLNTVNTVFSLGNFTGAVDDLKIYNNALSDAEVSSLYNNAILPVKIESFTGTLKNNNTQLNWITSSEYNAENYEVEYSNDGKDFTKAGTVEAKGNSNTKQQYSFTHTINTQPVHYYRLKMNDKDGSFKYSNIVKLKSETKQFEALVYPTITNGSATLSISSPEKLNATISIHTIEGKKIKQQNTAVAQGSQTIPLDLSQLTNGYYLITISGNGYNKTLKVIKQ